jgi:Raf kinase inhibitor-like YbhB/YbcL family protein
MVTSPAFADGGAIPVRFTCEGADEAPVVEWSGGSGTGGMVLEMTDPDAHGFVHWLVYGFGGASGRVGGNIDLGQEGRNDFGTDGYRGPCPPHGDAPHRYVITLYEFEAVPSPVTEGERPDEVLGGDPIAEGTLTGTYARA